MRLVWPLVFTTLAMLATRAGALPLDGNEAVAVGPLPAHLQGRHPLAEPVCTGQVRQLLPLDHRHVVVAIYDVPEVVAKVDALAGGRLLAAVEAWKRSEAAGRPDWAAFKLPAALHAEFLARAREELGERRLDEPSAYSVTSPDDTRYARPLPPAQVARSFVSLGGGRVPGGHEVDYAHYAILALPHPLQPGAAYEIEVADRGSVRFRYDELALVSRALKVNQAGYLPAAGPKRAYLGGFAGGLGPLPLEQATTFRVIEVGSGREVLTGSVRLEERNPRFAPKPDSAPGSPRPTMYGEDVHVLDLGPLTDEGVFLITVPGVGRSWPFRHGRHAYGEAFYIAARGFFHQRAATHLDARHTAWARPRSPLHDRILEGSYVAFPIQAEPPKGYEIFDAVAASADPDRVVEDVVGGWYDAADWDRNDRHLVAVHDMLTAYEARPEAFTDGQLFLPESGNGVPDLLDEAAWGLECWRRSQNPAGGISGFIETSTHPAYDDPRHPYVFSRRTRWSSLGYAAAAAHLARLLAGFDDPAAVRWAESARRAWEFGTDPANSLGRVTLAARRQRGRGEPYELAWEEKDDLVAPFRLHAALELARLTGERSFLEGVAADAEAGHAPFQWRFSHRDASGWMYAGLALDPDRRLPPELVARWRQRFIAEADRLVAQLETMPYRQTWPREQDYWAGWGATAVVNFNRCLFVAWRLTGEPRYRDAIVANTDFMLGCNPLGLSWTTGIGCAYPIDIQHAWSERDGIVDPVPGLTIYGINGGPAMHHRGRDLVWDVRGTGPEPVRFLAEAGRQVPFYRCWSAHPHLNTGQCEFTVHETCAALLFSTAILLEPGWMPDAELRGRRPRRPEDLFGSWPPP